MGLFDWWVGLPRWLRVGVALAFLALSTILWLAVPHLGGFVFPALWVIRLAALGWAIGFVLLVFSFPTKSQRRGYHDF